MAESVYSPGKFLTAEEVVQNLQGEELARLSAEALSELRRAYPLADLQVFLPNGPVLWTWLGSTEDYTVVSG